MTWGWGPSHQRRRARPRPRRVTRRPTGAPLAAGVAVTLAAGLVGTITVTVMFTLAVALTAAPAGATPPRAVMGAPAAISRVASTPVASPYAPPAVPSGSSPIVAAEATPTGDGAWEAADDGAVYAFGAAPSEGSLASTHLNRPIVGMAAAATGKGYWLVASDGGIFTFGTARYHGSMGGSHLNAPIEAMAADPATGGYWLVASDGGIFAFTAPFYGSMGGTHLNRPIVGMAAAATGRGYWLVASDGGIFTFGTARYHGSMGGSHLNAPIEAMAADPATGGYWLVASDGGIFAFTAPFYGSLAGTASPVSAMASEDGGQAYLLCDKAGGCQAGSADDTLGARPDLPPDEPPSNVAPDPTYQFAQASGAGQTAGPCWAVDVSGHTSQVEPDFTRPACVAAEVGATDHARALEGVGAMRLPSNFTSLTPEEQLFVLTDLERVGRGEQPVLGLSATLDQDAQQGAQGNADPSFSALSSIRTWTSAGSNWAAARSPLDADYAWLYFDGWDGSATTNADCTGPGASGCWGHRDNILVTSATLVMGAGAADRNWNGFNSYAELFVSLRSASDAPTLFYTWSDALAAGAAG